MTVKYKTTIVNNLTSPGSFFLQQSYTTPDKGWRWQSLAWFGNYLHPGTNVIIPWTKDYSFMWSKGALKPGHTFKECGVQPADPHDRNKNSIGFFYKRDYYYFGETNETTPIGQLGIYCGSIPEKGASIAVAVSGAPAFCCEALAHRREILGPFIRYWVVYSEYYEEGMVVDPKSIITRVEIKFPPGVYEHHVTLNSDMKWKVR